MVTDVALQIGHYPWGTTGWQL